MRRCCHWWQLLVGLSLLVLVLLQCVPTPSRAASAPLQGVHQATVPLLCPSALMFGLTTQCAIDALSERDTYPFTAAAHDRVKIRIQVVSGTLDPAIHVYSPTGEQLCVAFTSQVLAEIGNCALPVAGSYTLFVDDTYRS